MDAKDKREQVMLELVKHRSQLFAYIFSVLGDPDRSEEVCQNACLAIIRKWDQFELGTSFRSWSFAVARFEIMAHVQKRQEVPLAPEELQTLTRVWEEEPRPEAEDLKREALRRCVGKLPDQKRKVLQLRYEQGFGCERVADALGKKVGAIHMLLRRLREALRDCVRREMGTLADEHG
jgi:RNA polymerase sigma-70 factor (ECF subfamily)